MDLDGGWPGRKSLVSGWDPRLLIHRGALGEESGSIDLGLLICEMGILPANEGCLARGNNAFGRLSEESGASQVFRIMSHFHTAFIAFFKGKGYVGKFCEKGNIYTCRSALRACRWPPPLPCEADAGPGTATAPAPSLPLRPQHAASPRPEGMLAGPLGAEGGRPLRGVDLNSRLPKGNGCGVWRAEEACSTSRKEKGINHGFHLPLGATPPPESSRKGTLALLG